ncbi:MAG TPA: trypsin-like peptidase domain-containing protein [Candidatus Acidoferrum sp.]|nr:trypsin-like peptidase domain-containing protein [Candidatus Acidoferrum sp.]
MPAELLELSNHLAELTESAAGLAVAVHTEARGSSSGVIWRPGIVVTAEHALRRDEEIQLTLPNGKVAAAQLAGRDPSTDLAVLKCAEAAPGPAIIGGAEAFKPGSLVLVVGRTRASGPVAAFGAVSLVASERRSWSGGALSPYVRLDVSLQPTAVGGAIVHANGKIAGIATPRFARFGALLLPAQLVDRVTDTLLAKGRIPKGYLGVGLQTVRLPDALLKSLRREEKTAAILLDVESGSPAQKAGLVIGDILISLGVGTVARIEDVQPHLHAENIGKPLAAKVVRGGALKEVNLVVAERPHGES